MTDIEVYGYIFGWGFFIWAAVIGTIIFLYTFVLNDDE